MKPEKCEYCEGVVKAAVVRVPFHYRKETIYVDHVPVWLCGQCGEIYYEAAVYKRLEKIAANRSAIKKSITFPLADYVMAESLGA
ncbi:MAG: type II toxin-antitoxin system MqsA family antitoxin [Acidobacteria bacterium]|nr:type II toxin-antitoxin system MqsA family antitoxin [Acidobacteriota bacterium]